jgi:hypothetical protein
VCEHFRASSVELSTFDCLVDPKNDMDAYETQGSLTTNADKEKESTPTQNQ